jgi:hypothetical protein
MCGRFTNRLTWRAIVALEAADFDGLRFSNEIQ